MRGDLVNGLAYRIAADCRIEQQQPLEGKDRAPVLHRAEELRPARPGNIVELGQGVGHVEIFGIERQHLGGGIERVVHLVAAARGRDDADLGPFGSQLGRAFEIAKGEEQQVGRHHRRGGEIDQLHAVPEIFLADDRHVADRHKFSGHGGREVEAGLVARLVEHRREAATVGRLELGEQAAYLFAGALVGIVEREQAVRLRVDCAGIGDVEPVLARRDGLCGGEAGSLRLGVKDRGKGDRLAACHRPHLCAQDIEFVGMNGDGVARLEHLKVDAGRTAQRQRLHVGDDVDRVMRRARIARQVAGRCLGQRAFRGNGFGRGLGKSGLGQQRAAGEQRGGGGDNITAHWQGDFRGWLPE